MGLKTKPLILAFGHKMRQGKDEAARTILRERGSDLKIAVISFADALRREVDQICEFLLVTGWAETYQDALAIMCLGWDVEFDENAPVDTVYPHGKQRKLLQAHGQGRRDEDPAYWLDRWEKTVDDCDADVVIVTDMRYPNEWTRVLDLEGWTVKFTRLGYQSPSPEAAAHISETALNTHPFHFHIEVEEGQVEELKSAALSLFDDLIYTKGR